MIITKFHSTSTTQADRGNFDGHGREKSDSKQHKLCTFYDIEVRLWKHDNKEWNSNMSKRRIIATAFLMKNPKAALAAHMDLSD